VERSELHIRDNGSEIMIYVPRNERSQDLCFFDGLPRGLLEWIMTEPSTQIWGELSDKALNVVQKILLTQRKYVSEILDREGIVSIETPDNYDLELPLSAPDAMVTSAAATRISRDISASVTPNEIDSDSETLVLETPASFNCTPPAGQVDVDEVTSLYARAIQAPSRTALRSNDPFVATPPRADRVSHASPLPSPDHVEQTTNLQYRDLLNKIIAAARRATFPSRGAFDMSALNASLPDDILRYDNIVESFRLRSTSQLERDKRVGAAGELFVSNPNLALKKTGLMSECRCSKFYLT